MNRTKMASLNTATVLVTQVIGLVLKFCVQTAFIHQLSQDFLGLNGLFTNLISYLNFADLGIGTAITVALYRPIADSDIDQLRSLMRLYHKVYFVIGIAVSAIGLIVSPFLHYFISNNPYPNWEISFWFVLYLFGTTSTYYAASTRSYVMATQHGYINSLNDFFFKSVQQLGQLVVIVFFHSYLWYLIIQMICVVLGNWQISQFAKKKYPEIYIKDGSTTPVAEGTLNFIKKNVVGGFSVKFADVVKNGTDNVVLSAFVGLASVARYSNYMLIISSINSIIYQMFGQVVSSLGNLNVTANSMHKESVMRRLLYVNALLNVILMAGLGLGISQFIRIWAGKTYVVGNIAIFFIVSNFLVNQLRQTTISFIGAMGLYWHLRWKSLIEALANLVASVIFVWQFKMGISGVALGTLLSNILINSWWEPIIVYKHGIKASPFTYFCHYLFYLFISVLTLVTSLFISSKLIVSSIITLALIEIIWVSFVVFFFLLITLGFHEQRYFRKLTGHMLKKHFKR